jgi:hypothetical protein
MASDLQMVDFRPFSANERTSEAQRVPRTVLFKSGTEITPLSDDEGQRLGQNRLHCRCRVLRKAVGAALRRHKTPT